MKIYRWLRDWGLPALGAGALSFGAGHVASAMNLPSVECSSQWQPHNLSCSAKDFVREIDDASSGLRWMLFRDASHPGGPGRLVSSAPRGNSKETRNRGSGLDRESQQGIDASGKVEIRTGDRLIVQEHTQRVDLQLEGTALTSASAGEALNVRLRFGGWTVRAIAVKPGQAKLVLQAEVRQ
jgi:hypothetical protein